MRNGLVNRLPRLLSIAVKQRCMANSIRKVTKMGAHISQPSPFIIISTRSDRTQCLCAEGLVAFGIQANLTIASPLIGFNGGKCLIKGRRGLALSAIRSPAARSGQITSCEVLRRRPRCLCRGRSGQSCSDFAASCTQRSQ